MPAIRTRLTLDEQSFQGLLAAAFTIQQYNDRKKIDSSEFASPEIATSSKSEVCRNCMAVVPAGMGSCPACGTESFRPGERLQRTWAAMWMMGKEQGLWPEPSTLVSDAPPASAKAIHRSNSRVLGESSFTAFEDDEAMLLENTTADASDDLVTPSLPVADVSLRARNDFSSSSGIEDPSKTYLDSPPTGFSGDADLAADHLIASSGNRNPIRTLADLRVRISFRRADLYLGIAILVAFVALLWPAAAAQRPHLRPWERMLIAIGIAEVPQQPIAHYRGDPNIKVWVDTHTALYYCPGDELYGKAQDGHYTTQHDAQLDRFEPAERIACQ